MLVTPAYAQAAGGAGGALTSFIPLILIFAIMWFLLIRPQQKKVKEHQAMVAALQPPRPPSVPQQQRLRARRAASLQPLPMASLGPEAPPRALLQAASETRPQARKRSLTARQLQRH